MSQISSAFVRRQVSPSQHQQWLAAQEDELSTFEADLAAWTARLGGFEKVATQALYNNPHFTDLDLRFHRGSIFALLAEIERLGTVAVLLRQQDLIAEDQFSATLATIDQYARKLELRWKEWHGSIDEQADLPEGLKESFRELDHGQTMPLDEAIG